MWRPTSAMPASGSVASSSKPPGHVGAEPLHVSRSPDARMPRSKDPGIRSDQLKNVPVTDLVTLLTKLMTAVTCHPGHGLRSALAAAARAATSLTHVTRARRPHLGATRQTDRRIRRLALEPLHQLGRRMHALHPICRSGARTGLGDSFGPGPVPLPRLLGELSGLGETLELVRDLLVRLGVHWRGVRTGFELTCALTSGVDAHERSGLEVQIVQRQATEDIVHDRLRHPDVRVVSEAGRLEAQVGELLDEGLQRHAVLQADRDSDRECVHDATEGRALLAELQEELTQTVVGVGAGGQVALGTTHRERDGLAWTAPGQTLADRAVLDDPLDLSGSLVCCCILGGRATIGQRLANFAAVAVHRHCFDAELPTLHIDVFDLLDLSL